MLYFSSEQRNVDVVLNNDCTTVNYYNERAYRNEEELDMQDFEHRLMHQLSHAWLCSGRRS